MLKIDHEEFVNSIGMVFLISENAVSVYWYNILKSDFDYRSQSDRNSPAETWVKLKSQSFHCGI